MDILETDDLDSLTIDEGIRLLANSASSFLGSFLSESAATAIAALAAAALCGVIENMFPEKERSVKILPLVGAFAIAVAICRDLFSLSSSCHSTITSLNSFSSSLLATLAATGASMGSPSAASVRYLASTLFSSTLIDVIDRVLTPALTGYVAVCVADAAIGHEALGGLAKFLKNAVIAALSLIITAFILYITVSGIVAGGTDAIAIKTAKTVISNTVPVVGGALADAGEALLASTRVLHNSTGVAGVIALAALALVPFVRLGLRYLLLKAAGAISPLVCGNGLSKLIENLASAFGILLGMVAATAMMSLIATVSMLSLGGA